MKMVKNKIYFKSDYKYYVHEFSGAKSNTVRLISQNEYRLLADFRNDFEDAPYQKYINIECNTDMKGMKLPQSFEREITNITNLGTILGLWLIVISWKHE